MSPAVPTRKKEDDLKARLRHSKECVIDMQFLASTRNYDIQEIVPVLQAELAVLWSNTRSLLAILINEVALHPTMRYLKGQMERMYVHFYRHCTVLLAHAKSVCDAKEADEKIADFQFETFTPPYGITDWTDWMSYQRKTRQTTLKHVEQAVDWWEKLHNRGKAIKALIERVIVDLKRDLDLVLRINMEQNLFRVCTKSACPIVAEGRPCGINPVCF